MVPVPSPSFVSRILVLAISTSNPPLCFHSKRDVGGCGCNQLTLPHGRPGRTKAGLGIKFRGHRPEKIAALGPRKIRVAIPRPNQTRAPLFSGSNVFREVRMASATGWASTAEPSWVKCTLFVIWILESWGRAKA